MDRFQRVCFMLMKIVVAVINRGSDLRFFAELKLQSSRRAVAAFDHAHRHARLFLPAEAGEELINDMNDRGHSDLLLIRPLKRSRPLTNTRHISMFPDSRDRLPLSLHLLPP